MPTISDRVCPTHGDIGSLPGWQACPHCGSPLVMKGMVRNAAETILPAAAVGLGVGLGLEAAQGIGNMFSDALSGATDIL